MVTKYREIDYKPGISGQADKQPDMPPKKPKEQKDSPLEDPKTFKEYSFHKEEHYLIDKTLLAHEKEIFFNIYRMEKFKFIPIVEATKKMPVKIDKSLLVSAGDFVIKKSDIPLYQGYCQVFSVNFHQGFILMGLRGFHFRPQPLQFSTPLA